MHIREGASEHRMLSSDAFLQINATRDGKTYYDEDNNSIFPSIVSNDNKFIIVPVSDLSGLGILKLRNTTITYSSSESDNLIADCIMDITL